jgi:spore germination cell wall hydrolase CwlJ-like protein
MKTSIRAAFFAALPVAGLALIAGLTGTSAVTASDLPDRLEADLLPQSVIDAAIAEESALPRTVEAPLPSLLTPKAPTEAPLAAAPRVKLESLQALVARYSGTPLSGRESECLAGAIYFESKGEPLSGQLAVAEVILNRAKSGRFPASVCGVILQPGQFSFVRGGGFPPIAKGSQGWREAVAITHIARNDEWDSGVGKALFFHARRVSPGWKLQRVASVGNHVFYR